MSNQTTLSQYLESSYPNLAKFGAIIGYEMARRYREQHDTPTQKIEVIEQNREGEKEQMKVNLYPIAWLEAQAQDFEMILRLWQNRHEANQRKRVRLIKNQKALA